MSLLSRRDFTRISLIQSFLLLIVVVFLGLGAKQMFRERFIRMVETEIHDILQSLSVSIPRQFSDAWCLSHSRRTSFRLTVVSAKTGHVLCDSFYDSDEMTPLLERPEVKAAIEQKGFGSAVRYSRTMTEDSFYGAIWIPYREVVLRAGTRLSILTDTLHTFNVVIVVTCLVLAALLTGILTYTGRKIVFPMAEQLVALKTQGMRADFVTNVSHELRTPLTAIKGFADTLSQDLKNGQPAEPEFVDIISRNSTRLLALINDLLDLSSLESQTLKLDIKTVPTEPITKSVVKQLSQSLAKKAQTVDLQITASEVRADPVRLEQVLINLIDNARKYSHEGAAIKVAWSVDGSDVTLRVTDNGPGIAPEHHARLFERFYRVDSARTRDAGGTGLGLSIVKHILEVHGGTVGVDSLVGQGSTFWCRFPTAPAQCTDS